MPKPDKEVIIFGDQQQDIDIASLARVIVQFVRQRHAKPDSSIPAAGDDDPLHDVEEA